MRICRVATVPFVFIHHLKSQILASVAQGHQLFLVCNLGKEMEVFSQVKGISYYPISISRKISLRTDLLALISLCRFFYRFRPDIVHSVTPKAGFLCSLAGFLARIPIRLHTFTGQPWVTLKGLTRWVTRMCDRLIVILNTQSYADSISQRDYLVSEKIGSHKKIQVLGNGSLTGVDLDQFNPVKWVPLKVKNRQELSIPEFATVINFTGRINMDKGIQELIDSFEELESEFKSLFLILVGPSEMDENPLPQKLLQRIHRNSNIRIIGHTSIPQKYMALSDILCIPSYREGFGSVVIEAGAMGIPAVGTTIVGLTDSIVDGETGLLVPPYNSKELSIALKKLIRNTVLRIQMGEKAKKRAITFFDKNIVNAHVLKEYERLFSTQNQQKD